MGGPFDADAEAHFDEVAEAFAKLTNVDRDVGVDLEKELCMTVEADDRSDALVHKAFVAARTAVHTAGGATGTWDNWLPKLLESDSYRWSVTPSSLTRGDWPA